MISAINAGKHPGFLVYVAAPFSPTEKQKKQIDAAGFYSASVAVRENKALASELGLEVAKLGAFPVVPHTAHGGRAELEAVQDYRFWIAGTAALLFRCDAALFAPNWQESNGARGEHDKCEKWGIPIFYELDALAAWLEGTEALPPESIETESLVALSLRIDDRVCKTDRPIPCSVPSTLPSVSEAPDAPPLVPGAPRVPTFEDA